MKTGGWGGRQNGKTAAFYDETIRLWRAHFAGGTLVCLPDEYARHRAGLDGAAARAGLPSVPLEARRMATRGALIAYDESQQGSVVTARDDPRRVYTSWRRAAQNARALAGGTGWKHRVSRAAPGVFRVSMVEKRVDWGSPWAKPLGAVRMTVEAPDSVVPEP